MSPALQWISLGILFLIVETMVLSLDFLGLGIAAVLTGLLAFILPPESTSFLALSIVFLILGVLSVAIMRLRIKPRMQKTAHYPSPLSTDRMLGQQFNIIIIEHKPHIFADGKYRPLSGQEVFAEGDLVVVHNFEGTLVHVKKIG